MIFDNGPVNRPYYGSTVTGSTDAKLHKTYMKDWYGLTPLAGDAWRWSAFCAHTLVGKKCEDAKQGHRCAPLEGLTEIWDHARAWKTEKGERVITLEPWGNAIAQAEMVKHLVSELGKLGIVVAFEGRSPYGASYILFCASRRTNFGAKMSMYGRMHGALGRPVA
jgi:hypothetical protein